CDLGTVLRGLWRQRLTQNVARYCAVYGVNVSHRTWHGIARFMASTSHTERGTVLRGLWRQRLTQNVARIARFMASTSPERAVLRGLWRQRLTQNVARMVPYSFE
ncbi:hypothetical protein J6590_025618, partial [Homalodisca vitripennis]